MKAKANWQKVSLQFDSALNLVPLNFSQNCSYIEKIEKTKLKIIKLNTSLAKNEGLVRFKVPEPCY